MCPKKRTNNVNCKNCNQCKLIDENNFIELEIIDTDQMWLKKEEIVNLQKDFSFKPIIGSRKIYIIKNAEKVRENIANALLKFIEEPEEGIIAILISENKNRIINTILSRCQLISLSNNENDDLEKKLAKYDSEIIKIAVEFVNYYEKYKLETLVYTNSLIHNLLKDRTDYDIALNIMLMYYNNILNYKLKDEKIIFKSYERDIMEISSNIEISNILRKMDIIIELRKKIVNNVNLNLLIDKLLLNFEKVNKDV